jgi:predicted nucleotidyltransferase
MASTLDLLKRLSEHEVEFVIVGGVAGVLHGSSLVTRDLDICAPLNRENLARILMALSGLAPRFRMTPDRRPVSTNPEDYVGFRNLYLLTDWGQLDILSEIMGLGDHENVARNAITVDLGGVSCRVLGLDALILAKKSLNRPRDRHAVIELEAIRERLRGNCR